jgi:hypothetical protein
MMLFIPIVLAGLVAFLFLAQPHLGGGIHSGPPEAWTAWLVGAVGIVGFAVGLTWMIRIYRATLNAESRPSSWRSGSR